MSNKIFRDNCITLDGRMDEAVWNEVPAYTGFTTRKVAGGEPVKDQTFVKILPCENRVYFGIKCMESDMEFARSYTSANIYATNSLEIFFSPTNSTSEIYNLALTIDGMQQIIYFVESGNNNVKYQSDWKHAVFYGEDYWSVEIELPYCVFYHTPNELWSDKWLVNVIRNQPVDQKQDTGYTKRQVFVCSTLSEIDKSFLEAHNYQCLTDMPIRPLRNDIRYSGVSVELSEKTEDGYVGTVSVSVTAATTDTFSFFTDFSEPVAVTLQPGANTVTAPCFVKDLVRYNLSMTFKRMDDGEMFKYYTPITAEFEPIRVEFTLPEYRTNFYPGQDHSRIVGKVYANKPATLKLEGGGMATQVITADAEGKFTFETPDFQEGTEAILTASIDGWEIKKTMRHLAPTGHTMAWISGGRLVVNGKPVLRRNMFAVGYKGGEAFRRKYESDDLNETQITKSFRYTQPRWLVSGANAKDGEATQDRELSDEMMRKIDAFIAENKDKDYAFNYTYDEPEYNNASLIYARNFYEYLAEHDPYHPILYATHNPDRYLPYCDWAETDPYLAVRVNEETGRTYVQPIHTLHEFIDPVVNMNRQDKCMGFILTCFAYKTFAPEADYPTFDEYNCHTWVAINHGCKTIWSYAYHDLNDRPRLYEGTRYVYGSLAALEDPILYGNFKPLLCNDNIDAYLYEYGEDTVFVAANMSNQPQTVTLDGISGTWYHFRHNAILTGNTFRLKPFEVLIGTRLIRDKNLPTYQETEALINCLEAERMNNKSLLFERELDVPVTTSQDNWTKYKLFDGVRDNLACELRNSNSFVELDLTKVKPRFDKIVVSGWHLEDAVLKARMGEELTTLEPETTENEEFSATFTLREPICPDALRFEFPQERVELYEIEIF